MTYPRRKQNRQTDFWQTDLILTNNRRTSNRPIWLTKDGSKLTNDWSQTLHKSFSQYHHGLTDQSFSTDQTYNNMDWQTLFTWLWRWLPLRLSKRQSPTTVFFRTTLTRTITQYELHFNLPNHSTQHMAVCGVSLHQGSTESRKSLEQQFIFQIGTLNPHGINERFSFN